MKVKGCKRIFYANGNQNKAGTAIFISLKIDFKPKIITRDRESHYVMIMRSIHQEYIAIVIYTEPILKHLNI